MCRMNQNVSTRGSENNLEFLAGCRIEYSQTGSCVVSHKYFKKQDTTLVDT